MPFTQKYLSMQILVVCVIGIYSKIGKDKCVENVWTILLLLPIPMALSAVTALITSIIVCQIVSCPAVSSLISVYLEKSTYDPNKYLKLIIYILSIIYGIWNLDFFRMIYKPFCLHPSISILQIICLDYAIAIYPLMLVFFMYLLIKFHERFKLVQFL